MYVITNFIESAHSTVTSFGGPVEKRDPTSDGTLKH